nr:phage tail protein [uncultured Pantoea sp.]
MNDNEITDTGVMSGYAYGSAPLSADIQYLETYTSSALNRKLKGIVRPGFYLGFSPVAGTGLSVVVTSKNADSGQGSASIDVNAHQITVQHLADLTLPVVAGKTTRIVLEANYKVGVVTEQVNRDSAVKAARVFAQDLSVALAPNQLELCRVLVPTGTTQVTQAMIVTNYRINRQVGVTLDSILTSDDELIAANLKGLKILKGMIDKNMVSANNGSDIEDKALFRQNIELDQVTNDKQLKADENLGDLPDVPKAREHLGLGNAALANVQKSPIDMTVGALMAVGAFGLGGTSAVLDSKITSLADVTVTGKNAFWTLSGSFTDGPVELGKAPLALSGQLINVRRQYDTGASLVQLLAAQNGTVYIRTAGGGNGFWAWHGLTSGADANGWRKQMDSASMTLTDLLNLGAARAGWNNDITSLNSLTDINTAKVRLAKNLEVNSQIQAGFRIGVIRSEPSTPVMTFVRTDQPEDTPTAYDTDVVNIFGRLASTTTDTWGGRILGSMTITNMTHGGGQLALDARARSGATTARFVLNSGDGTATLQGSGGLSVLGGGGLRSDGAGLFAADEIALQLKPVTKDKAYYIRGRKLDNTLHWYLGQSIDSTDTVTWGNSIPNTWISLYADGTGDINVSTMKFRGGAAVTGNLTVAAGADFTGPVNILAKGSTAIGDLTNAALVVNGSNSDGSQGVTINSFAPALALVDRTTNNPSYRWRNYGTNLLLEADNRDNGKTWNRYCATFGSRGQLSIGLGAGASASRLLTLGNGTAGNGNLTGTTQLMAMAYANIGADATTRAIGFGTEITFGDGQTEHALGDAVEFWANSGTVNSTTKISNFSSFRAYDKTSENILSAAAFDGRLNARAGVSRWNLYMQGTAPNYLRGQTIIGGTDTSLPDSDIGLVVRSSAAFKGPVQFSSELSVKVAGALSVLNLGCAANDVYLQNATTKKFLRLVNDGTLQYDDQRVYHEGYKPKLEALNLPAGIPFPWPSDEIPDEWLLCNGAKFSATDFPQLAKAYPNLTLPDLRGEFIRGADNGRGVDDGRQVMSWQAATLVENWGLAKRTDGNYTLVTRPISTVQNTGSSNYYTQDYDARESLSSPSMNYPGIMLTATGWGAGTGFRVRPRNIAFNYIVRAA